MYKASAIMSKYPIAELLNDEYLSSIIKLFAESNKDHEKIQSLALCYFIHSWLMKEFISNNSAEISIAYNQCRDKIISFFLQVI